MADTLSAQAKGHGGMAQPLPVVSLNRITGFLEALASPAYAGHAELAKIAEPLVLEINDLFPIADALHILEFVELKASTIKITAAGRVFVQSDTDQRKRLFREHLLRFVPLAAHIRQVLDERQGHEAPRGRFELELQDHLTPNDADSTLRAIIGWGRYAELFSYDDPARTFAL
jgi:NitT/TauT family transport system ATP-binding protein